jgi:hypothetical protein
MVINIDPGAAPPDDSRWPVRWRRYRYFGAGLVAVVIGMVGWISVQRQRIDSPEPTGSAAPVVLLVGNSFEINAEPGTREASYATTLSNGGEMSVHIGSVGRSGAGLDLERVELSGRNLRAHDEIRVVLHYRIKDCATVPNVEWPLPVTVTVAGRASKVSVPLRGAGPQNHWQHDMSDAACHPSG